MEEEMTKAIHHLMVIGKAVGMKKRLKRILDGALLSTGTNIYHFILCVHELETI
jgi:hypothetical protein